MEWEAWQYKWSIGKPDIINGQMNCTNVKRQIGLVTDIYD